MRACVLCGQPLPPKARKYCSEACRREAQRIRDREGKPRPHPTPFQRRVCADCGREFYGHIRSRRCPACQEEQDRRNNAAYKARRRAGHVRLLGSTDYCVVCGKPYTVEAGRQKYCPECKEQATLETIRRNRRGYMAAQRQDPEKNDELKERKRRVPAQKTCRQCGKPFAALGAGQFCCDACCEAYRKAYMRAYDTARRESWSAWRKERQAALTREERDEINRRARENYRKRKERAKNDEGQT